VLRDEHGNGTQIDLCILQTTELSAAELEEESWTGVVCLHRAVAFLSA
jgi:hypothetical protein